MPKEYDSVKIKPHDFQLVQRIHDQFRTSNIDSLGVALEGFFRLPKREQARLIRERFQRIAANRARAVSAS